MPRPIRRWRPTSGSARASALVVVVLTVASVLPLVAAGGNPAGLPTRNRGPSGLEPAGVASRNELSVAPLSAPRATASGLPPGGLVINPNETYTSEPAPMGITDYGVTPSGIGYSYATPLVQGTATIDQLAVDQRDSGTNMTFQLNVVDVLTSGSSTYAFWIQDVAYFDTNSQVITWEDNVWNLSAGTGELYSSSVAGNGTVSSNVYYSDVAYGYPGSNVVLSEPLTFTARVVSTNASGSPCVAFEYDDGSGWVTFDNVTFPFTTVGVNEGFLVDGFAYTPLGGYFDAEWDLSGPGGGLSQTAVSANVNLSLSVWNGHNFQGVRAAYDHGSNTAERISNVVETVSAGNGSGELVTHATNGSGQLGGLFGPGTTSTLRVATGSVEAATLVVNGADVPYIGGLANMTLAPGNYSIGLELNGTIVGSTNVTLVPGEFRAITLVPVPLYEVEFISNGLPAGQYWSVSVGGVPLAGALGELSTQLPAGNYTYRVGGVPGYSLAAYTSRTQVGSGSTIVQLDWFLTVYPSEFVAQNDPGGVRWSVLIDGQTISGTSSILFVSLPNGSYPYTVTTSRAVTLSPASGVAPVVGAPAFVDVFFAVSPGELYGSVFPATSSLTVAGVATNLTNGQYSASFPAGNYTVDATLAGYLPFQANVSLGAGTVTALNITLAPKPAPGPGSTPTSTTFEGLGTTDWALVGAVGIAAVGLVVVAARRRRGPGAGPSN
ncbi:MAG: thermopsin family protease [Thermoplasmata archaeon]|nr:thermopsin family protease [Thermoplasmata archaeon]